MHGSRWFPWWISAPPVPTNEDNFYVIKAYCDQYYKDLIDRSPNIFTGEASEASGFNSFNYWVSEWQGQVSPYGGSLSAAQQVITNYDLYLQMQPLGAKPRVAIGGTWTEFGPDGSTPPGWRGQLEFVSFAPQSPNFMLTGSPVGGVWFSNNSGASWQNGGMDTAPTMGQSSARDCLVHPTNIDVWFCATGGSWTQSFGVYRTMDAGADWEYIGLNTLTCPNCSQIYELVFKPDDPNTIYAATTSGVWQTTNALAPAGSVAWNLLAIDPPNNNANILSIKFQPGSSVNMYASGAIMVQSNMAGANGSWSAMPNTTFLGNTLQGVGMAVTPADPDLLYAVVINSDYASVYRFSVRNQMWTAKGPVCTMSVYAYPPCPTGGYAPPYGVRVGFQNSLAVSPTDPDLVYIGDVQAARCLNGTDNNPCVWVNIQNGYIHNDIREIKFSPDGTSVWAAADGGMFRSTPSNNPWTDQNYGIAVATILGFDAAATDPSVVLIGQYDNATALSSDDGTWTAPDVGTSLHPGSLFGDGMQPMIDYTTTQNMWASVANSPMLSYSNDYGVTFPYGNATCPGVVTWDLFSVLNTSDPTVFFAACTQVERASMMGLGSWATDIKFPVPRDCLADKTFSPGIGKSPRCGRGKKNRSPIAGFPRFPDRTRRKGWRSTIAASPDPRCRCLPPPRRC